MSHRTTGLPPDSGPAPGRIPSLDGLRAVAIGTVVLAHLAGSPGFPAWASPVLDSRYVNVAYLGVRVFFVISGFLITGLLLADEDAHRRIRLSRFYLRRTLRIVPAYLAYVAFVAALAGARVIAVHGRDFWHALTWTMNYAYRPGWTLGHLWSLAVEEQFYLIWPVALLLAGRRRAGIVAFAVVCVVPFVRLSAMIGGRPVYTFETAADALAVGCLLALWSGRLASSVRRRRLTTAWWLAPALLILSAMAGILFQSDHVPLSVIGMLTQDALANFACAALIVRVVRHPEKPLGRILNTRPFVYAGMLSYSLYLWQQLFINRYASTADAFPINLFLAITWAMASYHLIERPFLRLRSRIENRLPLPPVTERRAA